MLKCYSIFVSSRIGVALTSPRCRGRQAQRKSIYFLKISLQGTQVWFSTWNDLLWAINNLHNGTPMFLEISLDEHTIWRRHTQATSLWVKRLNTINNLKTLARKLGPQATRIQPHRRGQPTLWWSSPRRWWTKRWK